MQLVCRGLRAWIILICLQFLPPTMHGLGGDEVVYVIRQLELTKDHAILLLKRVSVDSNSYQTLKNVINSSSHVHHAVPQNEVLLNAWLSHSSYASVKTPQLMSKHVSSLDDKDQAVKALSLLQTLRIVMMSADGIESWTRELNERWQIAAHHLSIQNGDGATMLLKSIVDEMICEALDIEKQFESHSLQLLHVENGMHALITRQLSIPAEATNALPHYSLTSQSRSWTTNYDICECMRVTCQTWLQHIQNVLRNSQGKQAVNEQQQQCLLQCQASIICLSITLNIQVSQDDQQLLVLVAAAAGLSTNTLLSGGQVSQRMLNVALLAAVAGTLKTLVAAGDNRNGITQLVEAIRNAISIARGEGELNAKEACVALTLLCHLFAAELPEVAIASLHVLVTRYLIVKQKDAEFTLFVKEIILALQPDLSLSKIADLFPSTIIDLILFPAVMQLLFDAEGLLGSIFILLQSLFAFPITTKMNQRRSSQGRSASSTSSQFLTRHGGLFLWKVVVSDDQQMFQALADCYKSGTLMIMMPPATNNYHSLITEVYPSFLYFAFMSTAHQHRDANAWNSIFKLWLRKIRQCFILDDERAAGDDEIIAESAAIDQVVAMIVWSLGSPSTSTYEQAEVAWKHMARWKACNIIQGTQVTGSGSMSRSPNDAVCIQRLSADHFLSIISQLLQHEWIKQSDEEQARSVVCLQAYLKFLATVDLIKFLPKVLNILDASMSSGSAIVRLQAVRLTAYLIQTLPAAELNENIPSLVMGLTNTFEPFSDRMNSVGHDGDDYCSNTFHTAQLIAEPLKRQQKSLLVIESVNQDALTKQARLKSRRGAVRILKELFLGEDSVWRDLLASLPLLPLSSVGQELQEVYELQRVLKADISQPDQFSNLCDLLQKEHPTLREAAVNNIILCFREGRINIYEALSASRRNAFDSSAFSSDSVIIKLIRSVLSLAAREQVDRVKDACARCLGEIGALDTSLVQIVITDREEVGKSVDFLLPWKVTSTSFALHLLTEFLVPELKSAQKSTSQDRCCYAIQQLLRFLADPDPHDDDSMAMDTATLDVDQSSTAGVMPEHLRAVFSQSKILDVVEPFWSSKYVLQDKFVPSVPPIYRPGMFCQRWIFLWCRFLISISESPLKRVFEAVKGVLRYRLDLCQLMLPYLIVDLLVNGSYVHFDPIITELMSVLNGSPDAAEPVQQGVKAAEALVSTTGSAGIAMVMSDSLQVCVQSVFAMLDRFTSWISRRRMAQAAANLAAEKEKQSSRSKESSSAVNAVIPNQVGAFGSMNNVVDALEAVMKALPLSILSDAASSIRAHARALRYTEESVRIRQLETLKQGGAAHQQQQVVKANAVPYRLDDNGLRPSLTIVELDALSDIYASLEDSDSVQGVQASRRMLGFPEVYSHRVVELELNDEWLNALLDYELVQNSPLYQKSLQTLVAKSLFQINSTFDYLGRRLARKISSVQQRAIGTEAAGVSESEAESASRAKKRRTSAPAAAERQAVLVSNEPSMALAKELISADEIAAIERGKLRCLVELGHLESVIFQAQGKEGSLAELQRTLIPLGAEAAWRLSKWDELDGFLNHSQADPSSSSAIVNHLFSDSDHYQLRLGRVLSSMHRADDTAFAHELRIARLQTMSSLSAASMESYGRSVPMIVRLQTLSELEAGHELLLSCHNKSSAERAELGREWIANSCLKQRMDFMPESIVQKSQVMAVRRSILTLCGLTEQVADNWLDMSHFYSKLGRYDSARMALKNAEQCGMNSETILIEECKILMEQGHVHRALTLLEPNPIDLTALNTFFKQASQTQSASSRNKAQQPRVVYPEFIDTPEKRRSLAEKIHLATQLMVEAKQSQGMAIIERYRTVTLIDGNWSQAYFDYGRYYEFLYNDMVAKEQAVEGEGGGSNAGNNKQSYQYIIKAVEKYGNCLVSRQDGRTDDLIMQALPRLLTLWLSFTSLTDNSVNEANVVPVSRASSTNSRGKNSGSSSVASNNVSSLQAAQVEMSRKIDHFSQQIDAAAWFHGFPQMVSRILHRNKSTVDLLIRIIIKTLVAYPKQGIWHIASLIHSHNAERKAAAEKIIKEAAKILRASSVSSSNGEVATMLQQASSLFGNLIQLAEHQTKEKRIRWHFCNDTSVKLSSFLVPTQNVLMNGDAIVSGSYYSGQQMFILKFNEVVDVASSKAKPKTLTIQTTCGKTIKFLCKQEKDGDLRKDARLMEFNTTVNRLLQLGPQGRKRKLHLRTFAVICLNEECGILEWVDNTVCLRHVINEAHSFSASLSTADDYPNISYRDIYQRYLDIQQQFDGDVDGLVAAYKAMMDDSKYRPCFHRWFLGKFSDPTAWLEARNAYTRSVAVWSGVGHVIGLGDRHTENILIDISSGECVHVDFDCLFDKGLTLAKPEIIPFRLTANMVDAMGVIGVEGCYRRSLEVCLEVLRDNKETLLSVLEPFLRDPTVAWGRSGRAQRSEGGQSNTSNRQLSSFHDHENKEANEMLNKVANRLSGVYNLMHPHRAKFTDFAHRHHRGIIPTRGLGASKEEQLPLSVAGQTQRLIEEATCLENLSQLYIGWQPWV